MPDFAATSADLVEALAYGGFRPGEILAACGRHYSPEDLGPKYLRICQRNVDGVIVPGTKSTRYPEKDVFLLGPLPRRWPAGGGRRARRPTVPLPRGPIASGRRASTGTGARTTSSRSREATVSAASQTIHTRSAASTRRFESQHTTRRCTSKARWGHALSAAFYGGVIRRYEGRFAGCRPRDSERSCGGSRKTKVRARWLAPSASPLTWDDRFMQID